MTAEHFTGSERWPRPCGAGTVEPSTGVVIVRGRRRRVELPVDDARELVPVATPDMARVLKTAADEAERQGRELERLREGLAG